jgi:hypothetical protein
MVALALVAGVAYASSVYLRKQDEWESRVRVVEAQAEANLAVADSAKARATELEGLATSLAFKAEQRDTVIIRMVEELPAPPEDCEPFTAPRDSVIAQQEERYADVSAAFDAQREATASLRVAEARARAAADSALAVLSDRPLPRSPLIPEIGLGVTAGICTTGQPCVAVGVQLNWKVRLF